MGGGYRYSIVGAGREAPSLGRQMLLGKKEYNISQYHTCFIVQHSQPSGLPPVTGSRAATDETCRGALVALTALP